MARAATPLRAKPARRHGKPPADPATGSASAPDAAGGDRADGSPARKHIERYLSSLEVERQCSKHTLTAYRHELTLLASMAHAADADCNLLTLQAHQIRRVTMQLRARELSPRSIARTLSAWRSFYNWLAERGEIAANPVIGLRAPRVHKGLPKALTPDQAIALVSTSAPNQTATDPLQLRDLAMFELLYSSGLRLSELTTLDIAPIKQPDHESRGWVDFDGGEVTVTGKGKKERIVPVGEPALNALRRWLAVRPQFERADSSADDAHALFLSERGTRLSGRSVQLRLNAHAQRLGIPARVHPHVLRHSFASHVLQSSGDLRAVQELLGHTSIAATQIYTSLDFQHLATVYDKAHPRAKKSDADNQS